MALGRRSELFHREAKLKKFAPDIEKYRFKERIAVKNFHVIQEKSEEVSPEIPCEGWKPTSVGFKWGELDNYLWIKLNFEFPEHWKKEKIVGIFDFGFGKPGLTIGAETLLFVDGHPFKGVDSNHMEVVLPNTLQSNTEFIFRSWCGVPNLHRYNRREDGFQEVKGPIGEIHTIKTMDFGILDKKINEFYYDVEAIMQTVHVLKDSNSTESDALLRAVDKAYRLIDPTIQEFDEDAHRKQLYVAHDILIEEKRKIKKLSQVKFSAVGQSHIDVAWLWRIKHTREKIARTFSTALRLIEEYPDFIYMQSQPQLLEYLKQDYPSIFDQIKERVKEGRFEVDGAMWLESDCNIPSGESLTRQILYGKKFMKEEFDIESKYLWMPDVFGYSWALPQILKKSDVDTFCTTKMAWNQYNRMPFNTFWWKGLDGTEILTHLIEDVNFMDMEAKTMVQGWEKYKDKELAEGILYQFGLGDGGGGPTARNIEMLHRFNDMPGLPYIEMEKAGDYFDRLNDTASTTEEYVHKWDGELYLELHRGTLTSQAFTKRYNRELEFLYRETESVGVLASLLNDSWNIYDAQLIEKNWKTVLLNQFHDIIPGSSIAEVYHDAREDYEKAKHDILQYKSQLQASITQLSSHSYSVYNNSNWEINDSVVIRDIEKEGVFTRDGQELISEKIDEGYLIYLDNMQPLSYTTIKFNEQECVQDEIFKFEDNIIETPYYEIQINDSGNITSLYDKENQRQVLAQGEYANHLQSFEDRPLYWEAWDVDIFYKDKPKNVDELVSIEVVENNRLRIVLRFTWKHLKSTIALDLILYAKDRRIDFKTFVDWHESQRLLRTSFGVDIRSNKATYDIQYGNCERPTHWNTSWDLARFEVVGHKWADLSEYSYGVALLNDCKYGHDIKENKMGLTLIKSGINPDPDADQGEHYFTYSLLPHKGTWREAGVEEGSWKLNNPLTYTQGQIDNRSLFKINCDAVEIDAVKKAEYSDSVILRLHEFKGGRQKIKITSDFEIESFQEVNLIEREIGDKMITNQVNVDIDPYEIKTYKVKFK